MSPTSLSPAFSISEWQNHFVDDFWKIEKCVTRICYYAEVLKMAQNVIGGGNVTCVWLNHVAKLWVFIALKFRLNRNWNSFWLPVLLKNPFLRILTFWKWTITYRNRYHTSFFVGQKFRVKKRKNVSMLLIVRLKCRSGYLLFPHVTRQDDTSLWYWSRWTKSQF